MSDMIGDEPEQKPRIGPFRSLIVRLLAPKYKPVEEDSGFFGRFFREPVQPSLEETGETPGIRNYKREEFKKRWWRGVFPLILGLGSIVLSTVGYGLALLAPILFKALAGLALAGIGFGTPVGWTILGVLAFIALEVVVIAAIGLASKYNLGGAFTFKLSSLREVVIGLVTPLEKDKDRVIEATDAERSELRSSKVGNEIEMVELRRATPLISEQLSQSAKVVPPALEAVSENKNEVEATQKKPGIGGS